MPPSSVQPGTEPHTLLRDSSGTPRATDGQLAQFVATHGALLYRIAYAITQSHALAEEAVQDALFRAWLHMPSWEGDTPVKWLRVVTRNCAITIIRKEGRLTAPLDWEGTPSLSAEVERTVVARAHASAVAKALAELDAEARTMIVLRETENLSYGEIGELLGMTVSAVKAKLYRSRHTLRQRLSGWEV